MITGIVVDDDRMTRTLVRQLLESQQLVTVIAEADNGADAVVLARENHPDVVIMDVEMPIMNGAEAAERIHSESPATIVVIFTTTHPHSACDRSSAYAWIPKPNLNVLAATVRSAIAGRAA